MNYIILVIFTALTVSPLLLRAQGAAPDAAMQANYLLMEKAGDAYERVEGYRVKGSPYLFGKGYPGIVYQKGAEPNATELFYNVYRQQVYLQLAGQARPELLVPNVDSFSLNISGETYNGKLTFMNGAQIGLSDKVFAQRIIGTGTHKLYKVYDMQLAASTTNLMESDLRSYELTRQFYVVSNGGTAVKVRPTYYGLEKALKKVDISKFGTPGDYDTDFEQAARNALMMLNNQ